MKTWNKLLIGIIFATSYCIMPAFSQIVCYGPQTLKSNYLLRELIKLHYVIKNISPDTILLYPGNEGELLIKDSNGNIYKDRWREIRNVDISEKNREPIILKAGDSLVYGTPWIWLNRSYGISEKELIGRFYFPAGHYTVQPNYYYNTLNGKIRMTCGIAEFNVIEPQGDEAMAHALMEKIKNSGVGKEGSKELIDLSFELVNKYPKSVYAEEAIGGALLRMEWHGKDEEVISKSSELMGKYGHINPWLWRTCMVRICNIYKKMDRYNEIKSALKEAEKQYKENAIIMENIDILMKYYNLSEK